MLSIRNQLSEIGSDFTIVSVKQKMNDSWFKISEKEFLSRVDSLDLPGSAIKPLSLMNNISLNLLFSF